MNSDSLRPIPDVWDSIASGLGSRMLAGVFSNEDMIVQKKPEVYHMVMFLFVHLFYIFSNCQLISPTPCLFVTLYEQVFISQQEFPGLDKLSPACSGTSTPRGNVLASHSPMSPENIKMTHRHRYGIRAVEGFLQRGRSGG